MKDRRSRWSGLIRLARLPRDKWCLALEAGLELALMKGLVSSVPPKRYASLLGGHEQWPRARLPWDRVKDLIWAIESVGQYAPEPINCLPRALALQRMLVRRGGRGTVRFGVKKEDGIVHAHAWLVLSDRVLIGNLPDLSRFSPLSAWPQGGED